MLSRSVVPRRYVLELSPSEKLDSFLGRLAVDVETAADVTEVVLNAHSSLVLAAVRVDGEACAFSARDPEELVVSLPKAGRPKLLEVDYRGVIGTDSIGLYQNTFGGKAGLATQLFSTFARRLLPCWDEPAFKAVFELSVVLHTPSLGAAQARSNAPLLRTEAAGEGRTRWIFQPTPVMSVYLLAVFVGECGVVTRHTKRHGKPVSVLVPVGQEATGEFAATVAARAVDFFEEFFGVDLPVPKVDLAGLLSFLYGGMENWGLIFFQNYILYTQPAATHQQRLTCVTVVCHEIAHNWFGNLVTIDWWHSLWLSEGFATFAGWLAVEAQFPEWDVPALLFLDETSRGLSQDANRATHPVEIDSSIRDPQAVMALIDSISYCKASLMTFFVLLC
jgi:aminopeptidase N